MSIPDDEVAAVRAATDIVAVISDHVALHQQGRRWVGLCPFHAEKTPSFSVNAQDGFYYCFGCHESGDAIGFLRAIDHLDFVDAVRSLAERAGVVLHESEHTSGERKRTGELLDLMQAAVAWYHDRLLTAPDAGRARDYLRSRGYDGDIVRRFSLGWAPDAWDALATSLGAPERALKESGLGFVNRAGRLQDAFRARVLFPIFDPSGRPVAIGGRVLPGSSRSGQSEPKYKNSVESPIYSKRRVLYGLNWAKHDIVTTGEVVVCEGYTDVIGCFNAGVPRAVATCGTAFTEEHFRLLRNYGRRLVLAYDADQAGQTATARVYEWERRHEADVRVAKLPHGADPAELARTDPDALRTAISEAVPFLEFRVGRVLESSDLRTAEGRARAAGQALAVVSEHPDPLVRDQYLMQIADAVRLEPELLRSRALDPHDLAPSPSRARSTRVPPAGVPPAGVPPAGVPPAGIPARPARARPGAAAYRPGIEALRLAVHRPELVADRLEEVLFADDLQRRAFAALVAADNVGDAVLRADADVADLLRRLSVEEPPEPDDPQVDPAESVVAQLVRSAAKRKLSEHRAAVRSAGGELSALAAETAQARSCLDALADPARSREAATWLLAWLSSGEEVQIASSAGGRV